MAHKEISGKLGTKSTYCNSFLTYTTRPLNFLLYPYTSGYS